MLTPQFLLPIVDELIVDLFAGSGGASTGIEQAIGRHVDIAINHDPEAVSLHQANHPQTLHFVSDVVEVDPVTVDGTDYEIADIGMRMLQPRELYSAQGFPADYIIDRGADGRPLTKTAQVRMCGNSVCPPIAAALVRANFSDALRAAA